MNGLATKGHDLDHHMVLKDGVWVPGSFYRVFTGKYRVFTVNNGMLINLPRYLLSLLIYCLGSTQEKSMFCLFFSKKRTELEHRLSPASQFRF